jgi:hypothetical protein
MAKCFSAMCMLAAILAMTATGVMGESVTDNFDSYDAGVVIPAGNGWIGWGGQEHANGIVSDAQANSGPNSLAVIGGVGTDQALEFGYGEKGGLWTFSTMTYVPSTSTFGEQYFNLMNTFDQVNNVYEWSTVEIYWMMDEDEVDLVDKVYMISNAVGALDIVYDEWVEVRADINLDDNTVEVFYGGDLLSASTGASTWAYGGEEVHGIDVMDIFPMSDDASVMYYDDISLVQIPEPATMSLLALGGLALLRRRRK